MFKRLYLIGLALSWLAWFPVGTMAQEENSAQEVFLAEPEPEPPVTVARHQKQLAKYPDGKTRLEREVAHMSDDSLVSDGAYVEYYENGEKFVEGSFDQGIMDGTWSYWHPNGQICKEIKYVEGRPDGSHKVYREDGTLESVQSFKDGIRDGEWITYYEDGETVQMKTPLTDGKVSGERVSYYQNGQVRQKANFVDGVLDGVMVEFDESGKKTAEAIVEKGKLKSVERMK